MDIIRINYDGLESPMLHTKFCENRPAGSGEEENAIHRLQANIRQSGIEKDRPRSCRQRITTSREVSFIVTSSRRYRFRAAF